MKIPEWLTKVDLDSKIDLLAFGPHPDDVELNIGGVLALHAKKSKVVVIDLTAGEMSSNGDLETRQRESQQAASLLHLFQRQSLALPDGGIDPRDHWQQALVVTAIRYYQPSVVLLPYWEDRHPDHVAASRLIDICLFKSGLRKYQDVNNLLPFRPQCWYYYLQHQHALPNLVVDVSLVYQKKLAAIKAYASQFTLTEENDFPTLLNRPTFFKKVITRDQYFGGLMGVEYGEALISKTPVLLTDLFTS